MSVTLTLVLEAARPERVVADVLVAPFFESDRPLRGPASHADWRLCGLLSERLLDTGLRGARGEAVLAASGGRLRAPWVLAVGLGPRPGFSETALRAASRDAVLRLGRLRVAQAALAIPGEPVLGLAADRAAIAVAEGARDALREHPAATGLRVVVTPADLARARRGLAAVAADPAEDVVVRLLRAPARAARAVHPAAPEGNTAYGAGPALPRAPRP